MCATPVIFLPVLPRPYRHANQKEKPRRSGVCILMTQDLRNLTSALTQAKAQAKKGDRSRFGTRELLFHSGEHFNCVLDQAPDCDRFRTYRDSGYLPGRPTL
jgi:hypothetical protein